MAHHLQNDAIHHNVYHFETLISIPLTNDCQIRYKERELSHCKS
jgi:hypothetical protein